MTNFEIARLKYKPETIKYLFIAEAPPKIDAKRFFYFENVDRQDSLFIEMMKCIYPDLTDKIDTPTIRKNKKLFLERFRNEGFYLIDSLDAPFEQELTSRQKEFLIKQGQKNLLNKINSLSTTETKIILISATVFNANFIYLIGNGINIINKSFIDFPGSGGQKKFREKVSFIIR